MQLESKKLLEEPPAHHEQVRKLLEVKNNGQTGKMKRMGDTGFEPVTR